MLPRKTNILEDQSLLKRNRTLVILGVGVFFALLILVIPFATIFIRILFAILSLGAMAILAFWSVQGLIPLEEYFWNRMKFFWRNRQFILGGKNKSPPISFSYREPVQKEEQTIPSNSPQRDIPVTSPRESDSGENPNNNFRLLVIVGSLMILGIFLAWIGTDGITSVETILKGRFL